MPRLTGRMRFMVGPSSTISAFTTRSSRLRLKLCSALAAADLMTLATSSAAWRGENSRKASASLTGRPRTTSASSRALRGVRRMYFAFAITSISLVQPRRLLGLVAVAAEAAGGRELAQAVADHVLADQYRHVALPIVDGDGVADHLREDGGGARPRPDHLLVPALVELLHLLAKVAVDERSLLGRTRHLLFLPATDDQLVGGLLRLPRAVAEGGLAPRGLRVAAGAGLALAATVRVVGGVHGRTTHGGPHAQPARTPGLAAGLVLMVQVTELADGGGAADVDAAQLAGGHADDRVVALLGQQLRAGAGRAHELGAPAQRQLDGVDRGPGRDPLQRQRVADPDGRVGAAHQLVTDLEPEGGQDVALLAVRIEKERDPAAAVGVVLDSRHLGRHAQLVPLEVDLAVLAAALAAAMADGDAALVVAAGVRGQALEQRLLGLVGSDLLEARGRHEAAARTGRLVLPDWHGPPTPTRTGLPASGRGRG